jgi:head-tail adaptor
MLSRLYNKRANVQRVTLTESSFGAAAVEAWSNVAIAIPMRIDPQTGTEQVQYGKETATISHRAFCELRQDIRPRDRVVVGATTYEVVSPAIDAGGQGHHLEVMLREVVET